MNNYTYDYIIVGGGPCGITCAWLLSRQNKKILLIEREASLGGCHRVRRVNEIFTEHGPRIYSTAYLNTKKILKQMNLDFSDYFIDYNINITNIGGKSIKNINYIDLIKLSFSFTKLIFNGSYGKNITCKDYLFNNNFSQNSIDYIDRVCRLTDGAGIDKYTLFEFLQTLNQNFFYKLQQPKKELDYGLFNDIFNILTKKINIILNAKVNYVHDNYVVVGKQKYFGKKIILAIPPLNLLNIIDNSAKYDIKMKNLLGPYENSKKWLTYNSYNDYISITFHWKDKIHIPKNWGFPKNDWGVVYIILSDYINFKHPSSKTVISACITLQNNISEYLNKTPNECSEEELLNETFRQIKIHLPTLPNPSLKLLSPGVTKQNEQWKSIDTAYMMTPNKHLSFQTNNKNIYIVGPHTGQTKYHFTSFESAVTNAIALCNTVLTVSSESNTVLTDSSESNTVLTDSSESNTVLTGSSEGNIVLDKPFELVTCIRYIIFLLILFIIGIWYYTKIL